MPTSKSKMLLTSNNTVRQEHEDDMPPGKDCLHAHHKNPIAERNGATVTSLKDLVLVCPNCHAVIETFHPVLTIQQLKMKIR